MMAAAPEMTWKVLLRGNYHQGDSIFNERSRGKQCLTNSYIAICYSKIKPISKWNSEDLDKILSEGDKLYNMKTRNDATPEYLALEHLPESHMFENRNFAMSKKFVELSGTIDTQIEDLNAISENVVRLDYALEHVSQKSCPALIIIETFSLAIIKHDDSGFCLFDPHSRCHQGLPTPEQGKCVLIYVQTIEHMVGFLRTQLTDLTPKLHHQCCFNFMCLDVKATVIQLQQQQQQQQRLMHPEAGSLQNRSSLTRPSPDTSSSRVGVESGSLQNRPSPSRPSPDTLSSRPDGESDSLDLPSPPKISPSSPSSGADAESDETNDVEIVHLPDGNPVGIKHMQRAEGSLQNRPSSSRPSPDTSSYRADGESDSLELPSPPKSSPSSALSGADAESDETNDDKIVHLPDGNPVSIKHMQRAEETRKEEKRAGNTGNDYPEVHSDVFKEFIKGLWLFLKSKGQKYVIFEGVQFDNRIKVHEDRKYIPDRDYRVVRLLGTGVHGQVELVIDLRTGLWLARKTVRSLKEKEGSTYKIAVFRPQEIEVWLKIMLGSLTSMYIPRLYLVQHIRCKLEIQLFMEYKPGCTFGKLIKMETKLQSLASKKIGGKMIANLFFQLLSFLNGLKQMGIVHLDIHEDNVLVIEPDVLTNRMPINVIDFGLSKVITDWKDQELKRGFVEDLLKAYYMFKELLKRSKLHESDTTSNNDEAMMFLKRFMKILKTLIKDVDKVWETEEKIIPEFWLSLMEVQGRMTASEVDIVRAVLFSGETRVCYPRETEMRAIPDIDGDRQNPVTSIQPEVHIGQVDTNTVATRAHDRVFRNRNTDLSMSVAMRSLCVEDDCRGQQDDNSVEEPEQESGNGESTDTEQNQP